MIDVLLYLPSKSKKSKYVLELMKNIYCAIHIFCTKTKVKLLSADEKVATRKSSPGFTIVQKNYEVAIEFSFL